MSSKGFWGSNQDADSSVMSGSNSPALKGHPLNINLIEENEKRINHFAAGMNGYKMFWVFMFACVFGVFVETVFWFIRTQQIESRASFVFGPLNLVYGVGGFFLTVILYRLREKPIVVIATVGAVIGCSVEYLCSFFQEHIFGSISWHYSDHFDIGGRTNLKYALFWGILAIMWIKVMYPLLSQAILIIPQRMGKGLTWMLVVFMALNLGLSFVSVRRWMERRTAPEPAYAIDSLMDEWFPDETMEKVFPNMRYLGKDKSAET
jgi:uncharacterized membrane protein